MAEKLLEQGHQPQHRGVLGILIGAALYSEISPLISTSILTVGVYGKLTLPTLLGVNHWAVILLVGGRPGRLTALDRAPRMVMAPGKALPSTGGGCGHRRVV